MPNQPAMPQSWDSLTQYGPSGGLNPMAGGGSLINGNILDGNSVDFGQYFDPSGSLAGAGDGPGIFSMDGAFGYTDADGIKHGGWGGTAMGLAKGLGGMYMGMKQYGLAKDSLKEGKRRYEKDYEAQRTLTNGHMEDRQRARVASNPNGYQSVGPYMKKNGVK